MTVTAPTIVGPYRLERLLGRGGMAVVYAATHVSSGRTVALKLVAPDLADPTFLERFRREGRMQAALEHPNVVTVYEAGTSEAGPYLAMRLIDGTTLASLIDDGALTSARTLDLLEQVAGALDAAHAAGLVHRDVKPRNVLVDTDDVAYLADFGLTRRGDAEGATATGHFMGTIAYSAPEVVSGRPAGPEADRYALAAVLFECLTATTVFPRPTHSAVVYAHAHEPPPRVSGRREGIPSALDDVLVAGLAKDPADRPPSATDLIARARGALRGIELGPPAPRVLVEDTDDTTAGQITRPAEVTAPPLRRRGRSAVVVAGVAGALLGAGVVALALGGDDDTAKRTAAVPVIPAAPAGTVRLGSDLAHAGRTVDCRGHAVTPASPGCTVFQDRLAGATLVVPRNGVVRRWGVRDARGEVALTVMRRDGDGYFQIARSRNQFVDTAEPRVYPTDLAVEAGDQLGLVLIDGSGAGVRTVAGAMTKRFVPALRGLTTTPTAGLGGEVLVRADLLPGAKPRQPQQLRGSTAAAAPAGRTLASGFALGRRVEIRLVLINGRGAVDFFRDGRRQARVTLSDVRPPVGADVRVTAEADSPTQVGADVVYTRDNSDHLIRHYVVSVGRHLELIN